MRNRVQKTSEWYIAEIVRAWGLAAFDMGWDVLELSQVGEPKNGLLSCTGVSTPDWSRIKITRKLVAGYREVGRGLRMGRQRDGTVVGALYVEAPDGRLSNALVDVLCEELHEAIEAAPHWVNSNFDKSCFLFRLENELEPPSRSRHYEKDCVEARVELLGSRKLQVGFMGVHSRDENTFAPVDFYLNEFGPDPATHAPADIPLLKKAQLERAWQRLHDRWAKLGWVKRPEVEEFARGMDNADRAQRRELRGPRATRYRRNAA